jgi:putative RNA 2'-phosphotransferase
VPVDLTQLSKTVSHALRHQPWLYELELDDEGWTDLAIVADALRRQRSEWSDLTESDFVEMIASSDKPRHEIREGRIRAIYGHSVPGKFLKTQATPPENLYHGTSPKAADEIMAGGLLPMKRQYVHLSTNVATALEVGKRKAAQVVILWIHAGQAAERGVRFYVGNDRVWLADRIPAEYIERIKVDASPSAIG